MTKRYDMSKRLSSRSLVMVAIISLIGIGANISLLNINLANKPKSSSYSGCAGVYHGPDGLIGEADLSCMVRYHRALNDWDARNNTHHVLTILLVGVFIGDGVVAYRTRKNYRRKFQ